MKKLVLTMGCIAAILLTSSCTADSPVETNNENLTTPTKIPDSETTFSTDEKDDPIPPRPESNSTEEKDDPTPPRPIQP